MVSFLDSIFNPWLGPVLNWHPLLAILVICTGITLLVTVVYKYTTNQREMKVIKDELKSYQKQIKEEKDPKKMMAIQKKSLDLNMKYMTSSFKSTLYTIIPILIIFAWLNSHIAYYPIYPNQDFTVTAQFGEGAKGNMTLSAIPEIKIDTPTKEITDQKVQWKLNGDAGTYKLKFDYNTETYDQNIIITNERVYEMPEKLIKDSKLKKIVVGNKVVHPFGDSFNLFGWYPGWLAAYIVLSLVLSTVFRKVFDVY